MKFFQKLSIFGAILCLVGLIGISLSIYYSFHYKLVSNISSTVNATTPFAKYNSDLVSDTPVKIILGSLRISLPVIEGNYNSDTKEWTLSDSEAYYASITAPVNNHRGGTLIYGHNTPQIFKPLQEIEEGDKATVITKNGYEFTYEFNSTEVFDPYNSSVLTYDGPARLFLQTCSGTWSQNRQIYYFDLVQYDKIKSDNISVRNVLEDLSGQFIAPFGRSPSLDILLESS